MLLSIDPGETVGFAHFMDTGVLVNSWTVPHNLALEFFANEIKLSADIDGYGGFTTDWTVIVCEDFRLRQGKQMAQTGSKMITSQVIGEARLMARVLGIPFITQEPQILRNTEANMHYFVHGSKTHIPDDLSAELHGLRYFIEREKIPTSTLRELNPARIVR